MFVLAAAAAATQWLAVHPVPLLGVVAAALLHMRAVSILRGRGRHVPRWQVASFHLGLAMILLATQTAIDTIGERDLVSMHMAQHLLIADLPAPLLLLGVRAPLLYFFWPRPVLVTAARIRPLRAFWSWLRRPPVALGTWLALLVAWHVPVAYEAALASPALHAAEHVSFALGGVLAWWPILDPTHERVRARMWKAFYVLAARSLGGLLGIVLIASPVQLYDAYGNRAAQWGMSPLTDQQIAGAMMMALDFLIVTIGFFWFMARSGEPSREPSADPRPTAVPGVGAGSAATDA